MKPFKEIPYGIRNAVMASEVREDIAQGLEYVEQFANTAGENVKKAIDPTLSLSGKAADAKATGDAVGALKEEKINKPEENDNNKIARAKDGEVEWVDVGQPTDKQTTEAVTKWLDKHPEATTTVQDGAIAEKKINADFLPWIKKDYVTPQMFGAVGDGQHDDTKAIQLAIDAINESRINGSHTGAFASNILFFPKGTYKITYPLKFKMAHMVDFGKAIITSEISDFIIQSEAWEATYRNGTFIAQNVFDIDNHNNDQGKINIEGSIFKGCKIGINTITQSTVITISNCVFDNVVHPAIIHADFAIIEKCWATCPIPSDNDSNFKFYGKATFTDNVLIPVVGDNPGKNTAWIEMNDYALKCENNRFGGEEGSRTAVNAKNAFRNDGGSALIFLSNIVQTARDEKSCIRLFNVPNTLVVKNNFFGELIDYTLSIAESGNFDSDLNKLKKEYYSDTFANNRYVSNFASRMHYDIANGFSANIIGADIAKKAEIQFITSNYVNNLNNLRQNTTLYIPDCIDTSASNATTITLKAPLFLVSYKTFGLSVRYNPNTEGSNYSICKVYRIDVMKYYDTAVRNGIIVTNLSTNMPTYTIDATIKIGVFDVIDKSYIFDADSLATLRTDIQNYKLAIQMISRAPSLQLVKILADVG